MPRVVESEMEQAIAAKAQGDETGDEAGDEAVRYSWFTDYKLPPRGGTGARGSTPTNPKDDDEHTYLDRKAVYIGQWRRGMRHGNGLMVLYFKALRPGEKSEGRRTIRPGSRGRIA
ncbi:hypothetical protein T484DRAFT_1779640 [Baffinella frigidus]|nr:hypothetical protein T484DRAFT_1779640 [Cryptophyta sp. CCMP2293]